MMKIPTDFTKGEIKVVKFIGMIAYLAIAIGWILLLFIPIDRMNTNALILLLGFMFIAHNAWQARVK